MESQTPRSGRKWIRLLANPLRIRTPLSQFGIRRLRKSHSAANPISVIIGTIETH
jgi:hypothetical protein